MNYGIDYDPSYSRDSCYTAVGLCADKDVDCLTAAACKYATDYEDCYSDISNPPSYFGINHRKLG